MLIKRGLLSRTSPQPAAWPRGFARVFVIELARGATDKSQRKRLTVESATPTASRLPPLRLCVGSGKCKRTPQDVAQLITGSLETPGPLSEAQPDLRVGWDQARQCGQPLSTRVLPRRIHSCSAASAISMIPAAANLWRHRTVRDPPIHARHPGGSPARRLHRTEARHLFRPAIRLAGAASSAWVLLIADKNAAVRRPRESHQGQHSTTSLAERDNRPVLSAIARRQAVSVEGRRSAFAAKRREWRGISNPER